MLSGLGLTLLQAVPVLLVFGALYYFYLRPIRRAHQSHEQMLTNLKPGDPVVLESGVFGRILAFHEKETVLLAISDDIAVPVQRRSIASVISEGELAAARTPIPKSDD